MKLLKFGLLIFLFIRVNSAIVAQEIEKKVVFVIVDGIAADVLERVNTPYIDQISMDGGYARAYLGGEKGGYSQTPTISAVGYNSLLTGTWANKHNVWDNDIEDPNYHYWTIFRLLKEQFLEKKAAVFSTWLDNRTKLIGDGLQQTGGLEMDYSFDGLELDTINFPHEDEFYIQKIDEKVTDMATSTIREDGPDLNWVYLQYTDNTGHDHGDSPENDRAIEIIDRQVGQIYNAVKYREQLFDEKWLVFVTTDHGRKATDGKDHGGQTEREKTIWISTNSKALNKYFYAGQPAIVDILPSIANYMGIKISNHQKMELDGVSLLGDISVANPDAKISDNKIVVSWEAYQANETVKIWMANTNEFNTSGNKDNYKLVGEIDILEEQFAIPIKGEKGKFFKIVVEGKYNMVNRWVQRE